MSCLKQETSLKDDLLGKLEEGIEVYRRKTAVLKHQQGLLYEEHQEAKNEWMKEKQTLQNRFKDIEELYVGAQIRLQEFDVRFFRKNLAFGLNSINFIYFIKFFILEKNFLVEFENFSNFNFSNQPWNF